MLKFYRQLNTYQKIAGWFSTLFIIYTAFGLFVFPKIIQYVAQKKLSEITQRQTTIKKITFNPYTFLFTLEGLEIQRKESTEPLLALGLLSADLQGSSLIRLGPVLKKISIDSLFINITRNSDNTYNFSDLIPQETGTKPKESEPGKPLSFFLGNISLTNGRVIFEDLPKNTIHNLTRMNLAIPFISNIDVHTDIFVTPHFSFNFNGADFELQGKSKPFTSSRTTTMGFNLQGLDLPKYFVYSPVDTNIELNNGVLSAAVELDFSMPETTGSPPKLEVSGTLDLSDVDVKGPDSGPLFTLASLHLALTRSEILKGTVNVEEISISSPELTLLRDGEELNIYNLFPKSSQKAGDKGKKETTAFPLQLACTSFKLNNLGVKLRESEDVREIVTVQSFTVDQAKVDSVSRAATIVKATLAGGNLHTFRLEDDLFNFAALLPPAEQEPDLQKEEPASPWTVNLASFDLQDYAITADDLLDHDKGSIAFDDIVLNVQNFSTSPNQQADSRLYFLINGAGETDISGKIGLIPLQTDGELRLENISLSWFQPFISEALHLIIQDGTFAGHGRFSLQKPEETPMQAHFTGDLGITGFKALDAHSTEELIAFKNLAVTTLNLDAEPFFASIESLKLDEPSANLVVSENGALNLVGLARSAPTEETKEQKKEKTRDGLPLQIDHVILANGAVSIRDRSISPNFHSTLTKINSQITGLSASSETQPDFNLSAMVNHHTPLKIEGKVNPLSANFFLDMRMALSDMDLGFLTPYSGKYAGYTIQKGKMSLDLDYKIAASKLNSKNDVFLDQFDFGQQVDSEDAVNAPVSLAVALLKDPAGRISLNLPVTGDMDDPEFSVAGIVVKMIMNLLAKAATAPFSLLGAMFGGGEDLNIITFAPGSASLTEPARKKMETLVTALQQRPGLKLDIKGHVQPEKDRQALVQQYFERRLKSEKLKDLVAQGSPLVALEDIELSDEEYSGYVQLLYTQISEDADQATKPQKKQETSAAEQTQPTAENGSRAPSLEEMATTVKSSIEISDNDLKYLAQQRALTVKDLLVIAGNIAAERIQTVEPESLEPQEDSLRSAGVIMTLR